MDEDGFQRLHELATRDQWRLADLDWTELDLSALPELFRQNAADAFAQLRWGEATAQRGATRLAALLPEGWARRFVLTQVTDEERHVAFFERVIGLFGCAGRVRPSVERLMAEVQNAETPEALVLGMQILIEGVGHSVFVETADLINEPDAGAAFEALGLDGPLRKLRVVVGDWMPRLLARDESRHIAFGLHYLRERIPALDPAARRLLVKKVAHWGDLVLEKARDPDLIVGVDAAVLCARLIDDLNLRIGQVGLATRIPAP
jgi:hypothetical protein